ncbi:MAG TPA: glycosyltransferase [Polyangiaceae bacterium]|nr:glycosyltransferase [Polyangiaceae bacterium]
MRIALVTTSWPRHEGDPAGHFVQAHARELEREGHEVTVIAPPPGGAFGWPGLAARMRERPLRTLDAARWVARARAELRCLRVDRVVAHWCIPCAWPIATSAVVRRGRGTATAPTIGRARIETAEPRLEVVSHGADVRLLSALPRRVACAIVSTVADRASSWTFPSDVTHLELLAVLDPETRAAVERISHVLAPPIEMPDVSAAIAARRRELGAKRVAVCVGRLVASKRVDRVIEHVARDHCHGNDLRAGPRALVVVGDGPERRRLERLARDRGVDARFVGKVDRREALAWIGAADEVIHASAAEGLCTVLREAAALGTPVVRLDQRPLRWNAGTSQS